MFRVLIITSLHKLISICGSASLHSPKNERDGYSTMWQTQLCSAPQPVPPSKPSFEVDTATPWVAGKKYTVACISTDAKPMAEITLYKGECPLWDVTAMFGLEGESPGQRPPPHPTCRGFHRSQPECINIKISQRIKYKFSWDFLFIFYSSVPLNNKVERHRLRGRK